MRGSEVHALKAYPSYRESGVPWLGKVPAHWETLRIKNWLAVNQSVLPEDTDPNYSFDYLEIGSIGTGRVLETPETVRFEDSPSRARRIVKSGDTIVSTVRTYLKAVWHADNLNSDLVASTGFAVLSPRSGAYPKFVSYLCQSEAFTNRVVEESVGVAYPAIAETKLANFHVGVPAIPEQAAIVRFLDHIDRRIQRSIRVKEKLITLLEEQKQAVIHQAVTGQIDVRTGQPYPNYKPSGVEWLGAVPAHWERRRLKSLVRPINSRSITGEETLLSLRRDHGVVIYAEHFARPPQGSTHIGFKLVAVGQLVVNRLQANNGLVFRAGISGLVSPDYSVFEPRQTFSMQYLSDLLRTVGYRAHFRRHAKGLGTGTSGFLRLYDDEFLATRVFLPSEQEQGSILRSLEKNRAETLKRIEKQERQLCFISEYRTRLIADVVTGKLDVREAAAALPDEADDPDAVATDFAEAEGTDDSRPDRGRWTAVPTTREEMTS